MTPSRPSPRDVLVAVAVLVALVLLGACGVGAGGTDPTGADPAGGATGAVVWRAGGTADTALRSFRSTPWNTDDAAAPRVVGSPRVPGRSAVAFTVPGGGTRSELEPATRSFREGDRYWFGFGFVLEEGFPVDTADWQVIAQWKNSGDGSPPLSVKVGRGRLLLDGGAGIGEQWQRDIGPAVAGERVDLVLGVRFSSDAAEGTVDVWQDGRHVVSGYRPRGGTLYPDEVSYLKVGLYRSAAVDEEGTVVLDDLVVARTRAAAAALAVAP